MYTLYIDESGDTNLRTIDPARPHFSLSAVITENNNKQQTRERAHQIKFKYWGRTDIVFHVVDLIGFSGPFRQFLPSRSPRFPISDFYADFSNLLRDMDFQIGLVCLNKLNYVASNPSLAGMLKKLSRTNDKDLYRQIVAEERKIVESHATRVFVMYLYHLIQESVPGQVVIESTGGAQDLSIFAAYGKLLSTGYAGFGMTSKDVRKYFTSISFVTKNNHDTETQLADSVASFLNMHEREQDGITSTTVPEHQEVINILRSKAFQYAETSSGALQNSIHRHC
jgi:hypothetical protein